MKNNKTVVAWILVILWMGIIFYLSHQPATYSNSLSLGITEKILIIAKKLVINLDIELDALNYLTRKSAHFISYLILGALVINATSKNKRINVKWTMISISVCLIYAISDELHQAFVPGRGPAVFDVVIDSFGASVGVFIYWVFYKMFHVEH